MDMVRIHLGKIKAGDPFNVVHYICFSLHLMHEVGLHTVTSNIYPEGGDDVRVAWSIFHKLSAKSQNPLDSELHVELVSTTRPVSNTRSMSPKAC